MKQTFEIPEGCNRVTIEHQGRQIITTFEPEFKEGDVLFVEENMPYLSTVFVFKKNIDNNRNESYVAIVDGDYGCTSGSVNGFPRHATEEEKQKLFDAMAKDGKRWNAEEKRVEDIKLKRWRAKRNEQYYTLDDYFEVFESEENNDHIDEKRYEYGSYFQTEQQAESAAEKIKELLKQINP